MPRIVGIDIPNEKRIVVSLQYIHGIGNTSSQRILGEVGIDFNTRARDLTEDELSRLGGLIEKEYVVEGRLRRQVNQNIQRLREIKCYKGIRHRKGLPVRGQRTQTNARTRKGKKKTVAGKKSVKQLR